MTLQNRRIFALGAAIAACSAIPGEAMAQGAPQQQAANQPVPSSGELAKMIWSIMAAVDHANLSGNYSVLRDMSASGFQMNNDAAKLAQVFAGIRASGIDLSNTLLVPPVLRGQPRYVQANLMEVQGVFPIRPSPVTFDMLFQ